MIWVLLFTTLCVFASAEEKPDLNRDCSVEISLQGEGQAVADIRLTCIRVGYIYEKDGAYCYRRVTDHALIPNIYDTQLPGQMVLLAERNHLTGEVLSPHDQGIVRFEGLEQGLYLIQQVDARADGYTVMPFLVTLPFRLNDSYIYDLDASAKTELEKEPTEPSTEPTGPSTEPTGPSTEPTEPSTEPTGPSTEPTVPSTEPTEPTPPDGSGDSPQTGQLNWPIPVMAILGCCSLALGMLFFAKGKKEEA